MNENINKKSGRAVAWSSITEILARLVMPIVNIFLARLLAPAAFGTVATITMVISFAEIFTDAGFQKYIVQHEFEDEDALNKSTNVAFWTNFIFSCLITVLIVIFRHPIAELVGSPGLGNGIAIASLSIVMVAFSSIQMARFKRDLDFKSLFFVRIGSSLMPIVVTIPLAFILRSFWALVIGTLSVNLFNAIALTVKSKWKPKFFYQFSLFKEMFSFSAWTLLESIVIWLTINVDIFILGTALDDYHLGIYKTSMTTVNSYMSIISAAIVPVLFSTLSRYQNSEEEFKNTYYKFQKYTAILVLPMSVGMFLYRDLVVQILLGSQWMEASGFVGLWALTSGINILFSNFSSEVYRSKGNPRLSTLAQTLHIILLIPAILLVKKYSFSALYITRSISRFQFIVVNLILMRVAYQFKATKMLTNIFPALISTFVMGGAGYFLEGLNSSIWWQFLSIFICIVIYFVTLLAFPKMRKQIFDIVMRFFNRGRKINCKER